jgi:hypothetical protein
MMLQQMSAEAIVDSEALRRAKEHVEKLMAADREMAAKTPGSMTSSEFSEFIKAVKIIQCGKVIRVTELKASAGPGESVWWPINIQGWNK